MTVAPLLFAAEVGAEMRAPRFVAPDYRGATGGGGSSLISDLIKDSALIGAALLDFRRLRGMGI